MEVDGNVEMGRTISGVVVKDGAKGENKMLAIKCKELKGRDELKETLLMTSEV